MSDFLSIQHKEGKLRQKPSFLTKVSLSLPYGTQVKLVSKKGSWYQISHENNKGWMHKSSLTTKKLIIKAGAEDVKRAANDDELVLAGKGFSEEVEKDYRKRNPKVSYAAVDRMERLHIGSDLLQEFVAKGGLNNG